MDSINSSVSFRILVIAQSIDLSKFIVRTLKGEQYGVTLVQSKPELLDFLKELHLVVTRSVDLILLENVLPGLEEIVKLEDLNRDERFIDIPVLIISDSNSSAMRSNALGNGALDFIATPIDKSELLSRVEIAIRLNKTTASLRERNRSLLAVQKSGEAILSTLDLEEVLAGILEQLHEVISFDSASVMLVKENQLEIAAQKGFHSETQFFSYAQLGELRHVQHVLSAKEPVIIQNTKNDARWFQLPDSEYINSWLGVPLIVRGRSIGLLNVDMKIPYFFQEPHKELVVAFATSAAIAIENARLFSEVQRSNQTREILISSSFDAIVAIDEESKITVFNAQASKMFGYAEAEILGSGAARLYPDIETARIIHKKILTDGAISFTKVDLKNKDGITIPVLLSAQQLSDSNGRNLGQVGFLKDLRRAQLMETRLRSLQQATHAINSLLEQNAVLTQVLTSALNSFPGAQRGSIHLFDKKSNRLTLALTSSEYSTEAKNSLGLDIGEGIAGWVFEHQQAVIISNALEDVRYKKIPHLEVPAHKAMISVPLRTKEIVIGVLTLTNTDEVGVFKDDDLDLLSGFADQVGLAIDKARALEEASANARLMKSLVGVSQQLNKTHVLIDQLNEVWNFVSKELSAPIFFIGIYDEPLDLLTFPIFYDLGILQNPIPRSLSNQDDWGLSGFLVKTGKSIEWYSNEQRLLECEKLGITPIKIGTSCETCLAEVLKLENKVIGIISIQSESASAWDETEVRVFKTLANQVSVAIRNSQLFDQVLHSRQFLRNAYEASRRITSASTFEEAIQLVGKQAVEEMGAWWTNIVLVDESLMPKQNLTFGFEKELPLKGLLRPHGISYEVMKSRTPQFVENVHLMEGKVHPGIIADKTGAAVCLPLYFQNETIGALWVHHKSPRFFSEEEREAWQLYASHASLALKRVQLLTELFKEMSIAEIAAELSVLGDLQSAREFIVRGTKSVIDCDIVTLYTYNEANDTFEFPPAMEGVQFKDKVLELGFVAQNSAPYRIIRRNDLHITNDTRNDPILYGSFTEREGVVATVGIPLIVRGRKVGAMFVNYCHPHNFSAENMLKIRLFANQAAVAIYSTQQFESLREIRGFVGKKTAIDWIKMVSQVWMHRVRGEVGTALGHVQVLRNLFSKSKQGSAMQNELDQLEERIKKIKEIPIIAPLSSEVGISSVLVNNLIRTYTKYVFRQPLFKSVKLQLNLADKPDDKLIVRASPEWLKRVFEILIENASAAMLEHKSAIKQLTLSTQLIGTWVEISIQDTGPGFPKHLLDIAFKQPIGRAQGAHGEGIGLVLAATICEVYGGHIEIRPIEESNGTNMVIVLPAVLTSLDDEDSLI